MAETTEPALSGIYDKYQVKTAGYSETFSERGKAEAAYKRLKNRKVREKEHFVLKLSGKPSGARTWETVSEVRADEDFYN
jgi:hypothetical protein